jgi:energy-coupling factor transporter ATP-binding protein EcfA2
MKISKLKIKNFKAFYGEYKFDFCDDRGNAKNILIYGENGSGKTSLYWVLYHIFNSYDKFYNVKKYKNIFTNDDLKIEVTFDNGNYVVFDEKYNKVIINEAIKKEFEKLRKIKVFLSYKDIFLLNELFDHNISLESFIKILENIYAKDIKNKLKKYKDTKKEFKKNYINQKCEIEKSIIDFRKKYKKGDLLNAFMNELYEYEDIPKIDKEDNTEMPGFFETIYCFSDEAVTSFQEFLNKLKILNEELEFKSVVVDNIIEELNDIFEHMKEKSKETYDEKMENGEILVTDIEEIDTIDILELIKNNFNFIDNIVDSFENYKKAVDDLNTTLSLKLKKQINNINQPLKEKFKLNFNIELPKKSEYFFKELTKLDDFQAIKYKLEINKKNSPNYSHLKFLNEAKISSINFAFYLSVIISYAELDEFKIIVLDDLLISLDMSNRDVILDLILEEFKDYQIIILTHDKAFFEMAKQKFNFKLPNKWKYFEMYIENFDGFEKPFVLPHRNYFQKAEYYLIKHDYSACANYLRKEAERLLKKITCNDLDCDNSKQLQDLIDKAKSKGSLKERDKIVKEIRELVNNKEFENFLLFDKRKLSNKDDMKTLGIIKSKLKKLQKFTFKEMEDLKETLNILEQFKSIILNPQSHDDVIKPLYKKELEEAMKIVEILKNRIEGETK